MGLGRWSHRPELCERFGIRRNTGYEWVRRDTEQGLAGLQGPSLAPHRCPHRLSAEGAAVVLEAKRAHRHWGPRRILPYLARRRPDLALPAPSTAGGTGIRGPPPPGRGPECRLDGGLQGPMPHRRWPLLRPLDLGEKCLMRFHRKCTRQCLFRFLKCLRNASQPLFVLLLVL